MQVKLKTIGNVNNLSDIYCCSGSNYSVAFGA